MSSGVQVGAATDTGPTYVLIITRDPADTVTDWTTCTSVVLVLPDGTTKPAAKTSATADKWAGSVTYGAWFTTAGVYPCHAKATFADNTVITVPDLLAFSVVS